MEREILIQFAEFLDNGFHQEEPFAVNYVDDFLRNYKPKNSNQKRVISECKHKNTRYLGDGDSQCLACYQIL